MPKVTDLPVATEILEDDIFYVVDPVANISKQIPLNVFRNTAFHQNLLFGPANQNYPIPATGVPQFLSGFASSAGEGGANPVTGLITTDVAGLARFEALVHLHILSPSNVDNYWQLFVRVDDGVSPVNYLVDEEFTTDAGEFSIIFNSHRVFPIADGDTISIGVASTAVASNINIIETSFKTEVV